MICAGWTKKTTVAAMYLLAYCVGNIIGKLRMSGRYFPAAETVLRTANLPAQGRTGISTSGNHDSCMLGSMLG